MYLIRKEIEELLKVEEPSERLYIRPLLEENQIGTLSTDFRLGTDFLIALYGREVSIDATNDKEVRPIKSFFSETRRLVGETFIFHPHQTVLCSTLEYVKLPEDIFLTLSMRSSYSRLGFNLSTIVHPGYCGCISIELTNTSNIPVKLLVGARILQVRFYRLSERSQYFNGERKYSCQVRPEISRANEDKELAILRNMAGIV